MRRVLIALVAVFSAVLLAGTTVPVNAEPAERALPERPITIDFKQTDSFVGAAEIRIHGKAKAWNKKVVYLQKKGGGNWKVIGKQKTNRFGKYNFKNIRIKTGDHRFRVRVPKGNGYRLSYSKLLGIRVS